MGQYFDPDARPDPEAEERLSREEAEEERRGRWRMTEGMLNFLAVVVGAILIVLLTALLFSMINWLLNDVNTTFSVLKSRFM